MNTGERLEGRAGQNGLTLNLVLMITLLLYKAAALLCGLYVLMRAPYPSLSVRQCCPALPESCFQFSAN